MGEKLMLPVLTSWEIPKRIFRSCFCSSGLLKESGFRAKTPQFRPSYALHLNYLNVWVQLSVPTRLVAKVIKEKVEQEDLLPTTAIN